MSLKVYLSEKEIDTIVDDYDFMIEEYEAINAYCAEHKYILSNDDIKIIRDRGLSDSFENWKEEYVNNLWKDFGDVPINLETEEIEKSWNEFPVGTHREKIWYWFEETYNISVAKNLMGL